MLEMKIYSPKSEGVLIRACAFIKVNKVFHIKDRGKRFYIAQTIILLFLCD